MSVEENIRRIRETIAETAEKSGRSPSSVRLMAVTKTVDENRILQAIEAGVDLFGENYIQEAKRKIESIGKQVQWHMIGHLQTNKTRTAVGLFEMIHSIDRIELAQELNKRATATGPPLKILIEVNVSGEKTKNGVSPADILNLVRDISALPRISVQGLMTMPPYFDDPEEARPYFRKLRELREIIESEKMPRVEMNELSMGMTGDYGVAIEEGATIVRIGRAIFGERPPR
jgi:PLP dependent protein